MTEYTWLIVYIIAAYFLGAIPPAIWISRWVYGSDIRKHGSGNAGATNMFRAFGRKAGLAVLLIDIGKGVLAVCMPVIVNAIAGYELCSVPYLYLALGISAALGHIYPVYAGFKGGKGVATLFGVVIGIDPLVALVCLAAFLLVFLVSRIVSVSSMAAGITFAVAYFFIHQPYDFIENQLMVIFPVLILFTHRANIKRLLKGEEPAFQLKKPKNHS